jgi:hypothetical protein
VPFFVIAAQRRAAVEERGGGGAPSVDTPADFIPAGNTGGLHTLQAPYVSDASPSFIGIFERLR